MLAANLLKIAQGSD